MKNYIYLVLLIALFYLAPPICLSETIKISVFDAPPYMIHDEKNETFTGIDIDIANEIAKRMNLKLEIFHCPWIRCLWLLEHGHSDLLTSVYKKPDREVYLWFLDKPYLTSLPIAFYSKKDRAYKIEKYEDLYRFNSVGVLRGASYFEKFDKDIKIKKYDVSNQNQLFPMLANDRIDVMAGYVPTENFRLVEEGYKDVIVKSSYEYENPASVFMAVSKKSPFIDRIAEFNKINNDLLEEGFIQKTIEHYYKKYGP